MTRLMSPSDFGQILEPFVFLDLFDHEDALFNGPLHPHSGSGRLGQLHRSVQRQGHAVVRRRRMPEFAKHLRRVVPGIVHGHQPIAKG
jgi:hypothetical protein